LEDSSMNLTPTAKFTKMIWVIFLMASCSAIASGQTYQVLYSFGSNSHDGTYPQGKLVFDSGGNLYGVTAGDGAKGKGTIFKLSPQSDGSWQETNLYNFCSDPWNGICRDGQEPNGSLAIDSQGNLYGTAESGGVSCYDNRRGCGTVFKLSPPQNGGKWIYTVLYDFCSSSCTSGAAPDSGLTFDAAGNLYGTTSMGGSGHIYKGGGVTYMLSPGANGWTETVLYNFCSLGEAYYCPDGSIPNSGVVLDKAGNLYGTTESGTKWQRGVIYELSPSAGGVWTESLIYTFYDDYAGGPVTFESGNLYSIARDGIRRFDNHNDKGLFELFPTDVGSDSFGGALLDAQREVLFGTTESGGANNAGTIWEAEQAQIIPLYNFCSQPNCADGGNPFTGLIEDGAGNLYGTAEGGSNSRGVVFELAP
jgi:uncharacterized repeat protein (TIGR03803 family)